MREQNVNQGDFAKALSDLRDLSKGHSSRGTKPTEVESMKDGSKGAGSSAGATQHSSAGANSSREGWAGSDWSKVSDNGPGVDSVSENGTDYSPQGKVMKGITAKILKGEELTVKEAAFFAKAMAFAGKDDEKEDAEKGLPPQFKKKDDEDEDEDDKKDMNKSLADFAAEDEDVSKGFEVSEFLASFGDVLSKAIAASEQRTVAKIMNALGTMQSDDAQFKKSLANAVVSLGEAVTGVAARQEAIESTPANGFRSVENIQAIEKGGYAPQGQQISKALIESTISELVQKGQCSVHEAVSYNTNGHMSDALAAKVRQAVGQ